MKYLPRIYVSAPNALKPGNLRVKRRVLSTIESLDFAPQEFGVSGLPKGEAWSIGRALEIMRRCDGAVILALSPSPLSGEEAECLVSATPICSDGALAVSQYLPTLVVAEQAAAPKGALEGVRDLYTVRVPIAEKPLWFNQDCLSEKAPFQSWVDRVGERCDVFFGYCSKVDHLARYIKRYLQQEGITVLDWASDFHPGSSIMAEVCRAASTCRCGLFLFTADDPVDGTGGPAAMPRDNVILEAGYFMSARGPSRVVIVSEKNTKMPADLGGTIYLTIDDRKYMARVARKIAEAIRTSMQPEVYV